MKPFDLEKALAGAPVVTRDGREVTSIVLMDAVKEKLPLIVVVGGLVEQVSKCGKWHRDVSVHGGDLFMATVKREGWVNVYADSIGMEKISRIWPTENEAVDAKNGNCIATVKIEWEE